MNVVMLHSIVTRAGDPFGVLHVGHARWPPAASHASSTSISATSTAGPVSSTSPSVRQRDRAACRRARRPATSRAVGRRCRRRARRPRPPRRCRCRRSGSPRRRARAPACAGGAAPRADDELDVLTVAAAAARRPAAAVRSSASRSVVGVDAAPRRAGWASRPRRPTAVDGRRSDGGGGDRPVGKDPGQAHVHGDVSVRADRTRRIPPRVATAAACPTRPSRDEVAQEHPNPVAAHLGDVPSALR